MSKWAFFQRAFKYINRVFVPYVLRQKGRKLALFYAFLPRNGSTTRFEGATSAHLNRHNDTNNAPNGAKT